MPEARQVYREVGAQANPEGLVERVYYPFAGADARVAFQVFEGPRGGPSTVLMVDVLSFGPPGWVAQRFSDAKARQEYFADRSYGDYSEEVHLRGRFGMVGSAMLWEIGLLGGKDVVVTYVDDDGSKISKKVLEKRSRDFFDLSLTAAERKLNRDRVRVDFTLDGKPRTILFVQHDLSEVGERPGLMKRFLSQGYDAYLLKADIYRSNDRALVKLDIGKEPLYHSTFRDALNGLNPRHGILVSDRRNAPILPELPLREHSKYRAPDTLRLWYNEPGQELVVWRRTSAGAQSRGSGIVRETARGAKFPAAYVLKEILKGNWRAPRDLTKPGFWLGFGAFTASANVTEFGLARWFGRGLLGAGARAVLPLTMGMLAVQLVERRFSLADLALGGGAYLTAAAGVEAVAAVGPRPGATVLYTLARLTASLYFGEKLEAWVHRVGAAQKLEALFQRS